MRRLNIRTRMLFALVVPLALMAATSIYTSLNAVSFASGLELLFEKNTLIATLDGDLDQSLTFLATYLSTKSSDSLKEHIHYVQKLSRGASRLESRILADEASRLERDARSLIERFITVSDGAVSMKRASRMSGYLANLTRAERIAAAIRSTLDRLERQLTRQRLEALSIFSAKIITIQRWNILVLGILCLLSLSTVLYFAIKLTDPIIHLSAAAERVAGGKFDGPAVPVESEDEIGVMARSFNVMMASIGRYIEQMRSQAEIESSLMEQKLQNLEMQNLLKHAELSSLQSRIKPHFLFNTLNAGIQLATLEDAERTRTFLEHLAMMMRYATRGFDARTTLREEIAYVEAYAYLMGIRFPGRIAFSFSVESEAGDTLMPKLIIQPLIENAVQHGFPEEMPDARASVRARLDGDSVRIEVEDNGAGFPPGLPATIMAAARSGSEELVDSSKEGSLGLVNVIRRLMIFTGSDDAIHIDETRPSGALITIRLHRLPEAGGFPPGGFL